MHLYFRRAPLLRFQHGCKHNGAAFGSGKGGYATPGVSKPAAPRQSATSVPAPPVDVRIAMRLPESLRPVASPVAISSRSPNVCARMMPSCLNNASYMQSEPASAPVWDTAALAPASERPILKAIIGLPAPRALSAAARNFAG